MDFLDGRSKNLKIPYLLFLFRANFFDNLHEYFTSSFNFIDTFLVETQPFVIILPHRIIDHQLVSPLPKNFFDNFWEFLDFLKSGRLFDFS